MVVDVKPVGKSSVPLSLRGPRPDVGPFGEEGAIESLRFAIGLRPVWPREAVSGHLEGVGVLKCGPQSDD